MHELYAIEIVEESLRLGGVTVKFVELLSEYGVLTISVLKPTATNKWYWKIIK